ncbi:MAG: ABC transporter transmembrane domain-containing protein, partial [Beijerinckiaceae bacterium]
MTAGTSITSAAHSLAAPAAATPGVRAPGAPGHPAADLRRLAARLSGAPDQERGLGDDAAGLPGPALVREIGERYGIEIILAHRVLADLSPRDCPAVLVLRDGGSRFLLEIAADNGLLLAGRAGVPERTTVAALEPFVTGGIFMGRRLEAEAVEPAGVAQKAALRTPDVVNHMSGSSFDARFGPVIGALLAACAEQRSLVVSLAIAAFLSGLIGLMVPVFTMVVFDRVIPHGAFETLWALIIGVTLLLGVDLALRHVRHALSDAMSIRAARDLGGRFFSRLLHAPLAEAPRNAGGLVQPYQEMRQAAQMAPPFVAGLLVDLPFFLLTVAFMASLGGWIALIPVVGALAIFLLNYFTHLAARPHAALEARLSDRQNHALIEAAAAKETVQVTGAGPGLLARWEERTEAGALAGHSARGLAHLAAHG